MNNKEKHIFKKKKVNKIITYYSPSFNKYFKCKIIDIIFSEKIKNDMIVSGYRMFLKIYGKKYCIYSQFKSINIEKIKNTI